MVDTTTKKKLEAVTFYKKTKCSVDIVDQMTRQYKVKASRGSVESMERFFLNGCNFYILTKNCLKIGLHVVIR